MSWPVQYKGPLGKASKDNLLNRLNQNCSRINNLQVISAKYDGDFRCRDERHKSRLGGKKSSDVAEISNTDIFEERKLLGFKVSYDNIMFAIRSSLMDPSN